MNPFFLGNSKRRLFGVYHPPRLSRGAERAVVLCPPFGHEYIYSHRSMARLATTLAAAGFHVLRFDYFGTGDSGGEARDVTLAGCRADIDMAIEELLDMSGADRVSLVGLRLGATLAVEVAASDPQRIDRVVLWDPVIEGEEYVAALFEAAATMPIGIEHPHNLPRTPNGEYEICGFPLTDSQRSEIAGVDIMPHLSKLPRRWFTLVTKPLKSHEIFRSALDAEGSPENPRFEQVEDRAAWKEDWPLNAGNVPALAISRIEAWMT